MKSKCFLMIVAMTIMFASCGKDPEPDVLQDARFSVLGDSFSAFEGFVDPETNAVWCYDQIGVTSVEQMWWHQLAESMSWTLERNNSFSGSLVCNYADFDAGAYYSPHSFLRRMDNLGNPDVIFIFGGTNDVWRSAACGEYVYSDWTEEQLSTYRPALAYLFDQLERLYPEAQIFFMVDMSLYTYDDNGQVFVESVHQIARQYHVSCIDLYDIHKDWAHPDAQGQTDIAAQVVAALRAPV